MVTKGFASNTKMATELSTKGMITSDAIGQCNASEIADAVRSEDLSEYTVSGTAGKIVNSIKKLVEAILAFVT